MKALVTGSEGYIGSVLVPKLLRAGVEVVGVDTTFFGRHNPDQQHFTFLAEDTRDAQDNWLENVDIVYHLAALSNDPMGKQYSALTQDINVEATTQLAKLAKIKHVPKFVFMSSCSVYGSGGELAVTEDAPVQPLSAYAQSKIQGEQALQALQDPKFSVALLRNSTVYGWSPNFREDLVLNNLVAQARRTNTLSMQSDGTPWRPLISVQDLTDLLCLLAQTQDWSTFTGKPMNVGFDENNFSVRQIVETVQACIPNLNVQWATKPGVDKRSYRVSFALLHTVFPELQQHCTLTQAIQEILVQLSLAPQPTAIRITHLHSLRETHQLLESLRWG